ncbi:MAG: type II secretion system F family protein [Dehalococcoidales bacterium]|nr:type II secretion system F family protein [Dehalococcoidales bacterium]
MSEYQYLAYADNKKLISGTESAASPEIAGRMLTSRGYKVLSLRPMPAFLPSLQFFPTLNRVPVQAIVLFSRQLALLLESGTPMVNAIDLLRVQTTNRHLKVVLGEVITGIRKGQRLFQVLGRHPEVFPKMYTQTVLVGEQSGSLESVLEQLADYLEKEEADAKGVRGALRYPAVVSVVALGVIAVLTIFVLPAFSGLYSDLGLKLPLITRMLFDTIDWFAVYGVFVLGAIGLALLGYYFYSRTPQGGLLTNRLALKMPVIGRVVHLSELSRCCRSMSILHKSGLPISEIMALTTEAAKNAYVKQALTQVHRDVLRGQGIAASMSRNRIFLPMMVEMVAVGEATGTLDTTLTATAKSYEVEAADRMRSIIDMIQPTITLVLGVLVALIASALVSAMYSLYGQM